ncbi:hypothetical protein ACFSKN_04645 [Mariniflexile gromovii]|uniref:RNA polymerase sigma factor (Sigma-70 family) n=1 Tax=Mariniflexile gromovii TaxID=362523 RepID=A0ABS4BW94_9FLAO|nr:hypothetical protein [Mariniflexile gromovii]MBP0904864.1 hypothetical protein [Mariniflexile gromovii]
MNLKKYVNDNYIKLSTDEVRLLFENIEANKELIVKTQLPLVLNLVMRFTKSKNINSEELFSVALEALTNSIEKYNNSNEATFTTFCYHNIYFSLLDYQDNIIRIPANAKKFTDNPKAYSFSNWNNEDNNFKFEDRFESYDSIKTCNESELIEIIKEHLISHKKNVNGDMQADIVIKYLGLNMDKSINLPKQAESLNLTPQRVQQLYHTAMNRLKENKAFKMALKRLTE